VSSPEYPVSGPEITPDDVTRFLIPDTPASLVTPAPARPALPSTAELIAAWEVHQASAALVPVTAPEAAPIVPRWVWQTSARTAVGSALVGLVAFVVWGVSRLLDAAAVALEHAAPWIGGGVVAVLLLVLLCRRGPQRENLSVSVSQTVKISTRRK
jgi:hypothetical protein